MSMAKTLADHGWAADEKSEAYFWPKWGSEEAREGDMTLCIMSFDETQVLVTIFTVWHLSVSI
jgi:hypothetical protein